MAEDTLRSAEIQSRGVCATVGASGIVTLPELLLGQPLTPELSRRLNEAVTLTEDAIPTARADYRQS